MSIYPGVWLLDQHPKFGRQIGWTWNIMESVESQLRLNNRLQSYLGAIFVGFFNGLVLLGKSTGNHGFYRQILMGFL